MEYHEDENPEFITANAEDEGGNAVNSLILDYYKKFGRKRDLEQYFSLTTAQAELKDPTGTFWRKMKSDNDSSDSGDKKSESSQEVCRISIRCTALPESSTSKEEDKEDKSESVSPPIIIEEPADDSAHYRAQDRTYSEDESVKSEDNHSHKSYDILMDMSINKLHSPSSSITSQRKLEWDSLADVGYGHESDRKTSASSLSTLEKLALKQQYSNNDSNSNLGAPTAHSTPLDENEAKSKSKKGIGKKSTKIYNKDVDLVEVNVPHSSNNNPPQSINVNLTKHISFNVEKDGKITVENVSKDVSVSPEKNSSNLTDTGVSPIPKVDREMQTSLIRTKTSDSSPDIPKPQPNELQRIPIMISLNTLRNRVRRKKLRKARKRIKIKKTVSKENASVLEKSGEQLSEAESFEYMPGHMYNQNQLQANVNPTPANNIVGNKSSLESSGAFTTDSSKASKISFSDDLKKSINVLRNALRDRCDDATLRKQLIKQVCEKLLNSKYRDDDSTSDFLSGLSLNSQKMRERNLTTSTSDPDSGDKVKPKKSILRNDKFNPGAIASTSQSAPNLPMAANSEKPVTSKFKKPLATSHTDSESSKKNSSDNVFAKTSSEELYQKYLEALNREQAYKKHLRDKEQFLKQKLVASDSAFTVPMRSDPKVNERLKDLIKDLTRNNYDDGSGDASKLEGGPNSNSDFNRVLPIRTQRSHSVFTLSSGSSEQQAKKSNLKKKLQCDIKDLTKPSTSNEPHYCCCPYHSGNVIHGVTDSSVQVNISVPYSGDSSPEHHDMSPKTNCQRVELGCQCHRPDSPSCKNTDKSKDKYLCLCNKKIIKDVPDNFFIYKCPHVASSESSKGCSSCSHHSGAAVGSLNEPSCSKTVNVGSRCLPITNNTKCSQTTLLDKILRRRSSDRGSPNTELAKQGCSAAPKPNKIYEATRCLQTEISIDPKIPEPSISDICILSDTNCAELISENCRELPKSSCSSLSSGHVQKGQGSNTTSTSTASRSTGTSKHFGNLGNLAIGEPKPASLKKALTALPNNDSAENYTIPIQGTNMILMVRIDANDRIPLAGVNKVSESVGTDRPCNVEHGTSLYEECSKSVQNSPPPVASSSKNSTKSSVQHSSNKSLNSYNNDKKPVQTKVVIEEPAPIKPKASTYPKSPVNERKPLLRTNTEVGNLVTKPDVSEKASIKSGTSANTKNVIPSHACVFKNFNTKVKEPSKQNSGSVSPPVSARETRAKTNPKAPSTPSPPITPRLGASLPKPTPKASPKTTPKSSEPGSPISSRNSSTKRDKKCLCGCKVDKCNNKCQIQETGCQITDPKTTTVASQYEASCTCGCDGENCHNKCNETTDICKIDKAVTVCICGCKDKDCNNECNLKCSTDDATGDFITNRTDTKDKRVPEDRNDCVCGCSDVSCHNKCKQTNTSPNNTASLIKQKTCKIQNDCVCGCDDKNCHNKCRESNSSPRDSGCNNPTSRPNSGTQTNTCSKAAKNDCVCGCDDVNCHNKCRESNSSPRDSGCNNPTSRPNSGTQTNTCSKAAKNDCVCGCDDVNCHNKCRESNSSPRDSGCNNPTSRPNSGTQTNTCSKAAKNDCVCGCDDVNCHNKCKEKKPNALRTHSECGNTTNNNNCVCGCDDDNCHNKCQENKKVKSQACICGCPNSRGDCRESCTQSTNSKRSPKKEMGTQKDTMYSSDSSRSSSNRCGDTGNKNRGCQTERVEKSKCDKKCEGMSNASDPFASDPILQMIQSITKRYAKGDIGQSKRKKCFKEIVTMLNYFLETDTFSSKKCRPNICESSSPISDCCLKTSDDNTCSKPYKIHKDRAVQMGVKKSATKHKIVSECSTSVPGTSSDSATCKVLNKIRKECERYHQKKCKKQSGKKCEVSSNTSVNCEKCRKTHYCHCRYKCNNKKCQESAKKPVAYNLILQSSESLLHKDRPLCQQQRPLKNIVVRVPSMKTCENIPFKELEAKIECGIPPCPPLKSCRSRSMPNESELSSMDEIIRKNKTCTVRDYLETNRPDFVENCSQRQNCLKFVSGNERTCPSQLKMIVLQTPNGMDHCNMYQGMQSTCMTAQCPNDNNQCFPIEVTRVANEREHARRLLSMRMAQMSNVNEIDHEELVQLAKEIGQHIRKRNPASKIISEREMKKHSEKIYRKLPEVVRKKEEIKKENEKKTNLFLANIFKRNLQKKTLQGAVNLSNYSPVVKI